MRQLQLQSFQIPLATSRSLALAAPTELASQLIKHGMLARLPSSELTFGDLLRELRGKIISEVLEFCIEMDVQIVQRAGQLFVVRAQRLQPFCTRYTYCIMYF